MSGANGQIRGCDGLVGITYSLVWRSTCPRRSKVRRVDESILGQHRLTLGRIILLLLLGIALLGVALLLPAPLLLLLPSLIVIL